MNLLEASLSVADELLTRAQDAHAAQYGQTLEEKLPASQARCLLVQQALWPSE